MKLSYRRRHLPHLLFVAVLLLVQLGLFAHQFQHQLVDGETHCPLCLAADHLGHAPVSGGGAAATAALVFLCLVIGISSVIAARRARVPHLARAPPVHFSR